MRVRGFVVLGGGRRQPAANQSEPRVSADEGRWVGWGLINQPLSRRQAEYHKQRRPLEKCPFQSDGGFTAATRCSGATLCIGGGESEHLLILLLIDRQASWLMGAVCTYLDSKISFEVKCFVCSSTDILFFFFQFT